MCEGPGHIPLDTPDVVEVGDDMLSFRHLGIRVHLGPFDGDVLHPAGIFAAIGPHKSAEKNHGNFLFCANLLRNCAGLCIVLEHHGHVVLHKHGPVALPTQALPFRHGHAIRWSVNTR